MKRLLTLAGSLSLALSSAILAGESYKIENVHSSVIFKTRHMQTANAWGRFNDFSGELNFDSKDLAKSTLSLTVKAGSVDTNSEKRDKHLRGADFFNVKEYEAITFKSTSAKKVASNTYAITGDLTLLGVTKVVTVSCEYYGEGKGPRGNKIVGAEATLKVKRSDFGMKFGLPNIGDEVTLIISVEALGS